MSGSYESLSGQPIPQRPDELKRFIEILKEEKISKYLEIGARYGDSFYHIVKSLPSESKAIAVDLVDGYWGRSDSREHLQNRVADLRALGYDANVVFGDSTAAGTLQSVLMRGDFDAVMIDGDHRFEGLTLDWINFGKRSKKLVAFHDIDGWKHFERRSGASVEVPHVWNILKRNYKHQEIIGAERGMGIGVLWL